MSHDSDVRSTSHDRHDPMLVAALAADDLAGADRDQALALTRSCSDCTTLHDDLLAVARATAAVPPPFTTRPRDFQLTPADAARLRPGGWRRFVAALANSGSFRSRPLGVGLATLGLVGLLVGNVQLGIGSGSASQAMTQADRAAEAPAASAGTLDVAGEAFSSSATPAPVPDPAAAPAASVAPASASGSGNFGAALPSGAPEAIRGGPIAANPTGGKAATTTEEPTSVAPSSRDATAGEAFRPLNLLFGGAIVLGIGLLLVARRRDRRSA